MDFLTNEMFLYLALFCIIISFALWIRSRRRRKKELERRRAMGEDIPQKKKKRKSL